MNTLLIEIGTEEIPAGYIIPALEAFRENILAVLDRSRIAHGSAKIAGTPRRLVLMIENLAEMQEKTTSVLTGPPERVGFDENGNPTLAAEKFAEKAGVGLDQIKVEDTEKGRYLTAVIEEKCESAVSILERALEKQILAIPFPKSMRWGDLSISFARPVISLLGLVGDRILSFKLGNIKSSSYIFGHQFMHPGKHPVKTADDYENIAESLGIIPDIEKRKNMLVNAVEQCARQHNARILEDQELVDTVTNLVEYPFPVVGKFDGGFLEVPDEVLITAMREHQKYFALTDDDGNLKPLFIAVNNTKAKDMSLVAAGHERVLRARLSDAKFFYEADIASSLDEFALKLKNVTFQEKLGSVHDKTLRTGTLVEYLAQISGHGDRQALVEKLKRAAAICKADLVSQVVIEFTKLQGVMGRVYALKAGEDPEVAFAIEQHYRPVRSGGKLPENQVACLLAIADKMDTICGCFSVGLIPTGGADPYALRRLGIGIIQIMLEENYEFSLDALVDRALDPFAGNMKNKGETAGLVLDFLKNRMVSIFSEKGFSKEAVNSAMQASFDNLPDVALRIKALDSLRKKPDFEPLAVTFKRVENIIRKAGAGSLSGIDESLFEDDSERQLHKEARMTKDIVAELTANGDYDGALQKIADLRPVVDAFFDNVMVMTENERIRLNRIGLLSAVSGLFSNIADFSRL
jgi:glycyl-tRNA synthetase beta chain